MAGSIELCSLSSVFCILSSSRLWKVVDNPLHEMEMERRRREHGGGSRDGQGEGETASTGHGGNHFTLRQSHSNLPNMPSDINFSISSVVLTTTSNPKRFQHSPRRGRSHIGNGGLKRWVAISETMSYPKEWHRHRADEPLLMESYCSREDE